MHSRIETVLRELRLKYEESVDLISKSDDSPSEPYKSKYAARNILTDNIQCRLEELRSMVYHDSNETWLNWFTRVNLIEALIQYELFRVANETEETCQAEAYLKSALECLERCKIDPLDLRISIIALKIFIHDGFIKTYFDRFEEAISSLKVAEKIYQLFTSTNHADSYEDYVCHDTDLFSISHSNSKDDLADLAKSIECLHTTTCYYIAQVYQRLDQPDEAASYCLLTLQRQYSSLESFDTIVWATNAAVLSQYYFERKNDYATARHMIAASLLLMSNLEAYDDSDLFARRSADIDQIIIKYCLHLLEKGHHRLNSEENAPVSTAHIDDRLIEPSDKLTQLEEQFAMNIPDSFEAARSIFLTGQARVKSATKYFTLLDYASDYCEIIGDHSNLYAALQVYESDTNRKIAMRKRRIKLLEQLLSEINVKYFLPYHQKFSFELASIYQDIALTRLNEYRVDESVTRETQVATENNARLLIQRASKVNKIIDSSVEWYNRFTDLYRDPKTKQLPSKYDDENVRPLCVAVFSIAKLTSSRITYNEADHINNIALAENLYNQVIDYYDRNVDQRHLIETEVEVIRELLPLLSMRKDQLAARVLAV